ncbi:NAD(P)/FAD-dependent oxidoreductase [Nocardia jinanensis]|uniref:Dehydrogenase n=1 Tax=Nocardia jinanensis TaxID=382504 RepID=A0A917RH56_9NOCA|nr:FAD-dependent oxidoreductase [Nocardia jinanensis]GGL06927.1 dehydrogenase [Nocardia jinanensis]
MPHQRAHVVVIGGGYAGTLAANRLRRQPDLEITLVNPRPEFVERIRLHQLVADTGTATVGYDSLLGDGTRLLVDTATRIDTGARTVHLASGAALPYDYLVYAVGSTAAVGSAVPGVAEFAYPLAELEEARRLHEAIARSAADAPVTVVGAGLTGLETATELAERGRTVRLICGGVLAPALSAPGRRSVATRLRRLGVEILRTAVVTEVRADAVVLDDGTVLPSAVTIWTVGFGVPDLARVSGLSTDALGRLHTDETLTSVDDDRVIAAGDAAAPSGRPLRMSCQAAIPLGAQAADTVSSRLTGRTPAPIDQAFVGSCVSLGRGGAVVQLAHRDDTPVNAFLGGRIAAAVKETICNATLWQIRREMKKPGSSIWLKGGRKTATAEATARP